VVRVIVAGVDRALSEVTVPWLREHIDGARAKGISLCIQVTIKSGDIDMILSTPDCPSIPGPRRPARPKEQELFDLWEKHRLDTNNFPVGELNAFLSAVKRL
jgi:hypothetical protein